MVTRRNAITGIGAGDTMVFVKVRETYDLGTVANKMSVIGIHTPNPTILKKEYPGLLMQCKAYRPVSVDIRCACASMLPADPLQVGTETGDVAPEDMFNPILYKAISNKGMSQLEAYVAGRTTVGSGSGPSLDDGVIGGQQPDFNLYYGLLADTNSWAHANPQTGFSMNNVKPLVYEVLSTYGDNGAGSDESFNTPTKPNDAGNASSFSSRADYTFRGSARPMPFINCTSYSYTSGVSGTSADSGFPVSAGNAEVNVPWVKTFCAVICVPPSRLHKLYYRMVVEWTIEFSGIRSMTEITNWAGIASFGSFTHIQNYSYESAKIASGLAEDETIMPEDTSMVSTSEGTGIKKVM